VWVVGNVVAGGAGKTPTVIALATELMRRGYRPGIVSRGHGRRERAPCEVTLSSLAEAVGDEPLLLHRRTGCPVVVGRDRVQAGHALLASHPDLDVVLCDDGLQHLALKRQAEVLVFDERGLGNGWLLPAGPLRERPRLRPELTQLVIYNAEKASTPLPGDLAQRQVDALIELRPWWKALDQGLSTSPAPSLEKALQGLQQRPTMACAGMARPQRFFDSLNQLGVSFEALALPDHHPYASLPWPAHGWDVIITEKDAVKIHPSRLATESLDGLAPTRIWVARLAYHLPKEAVDQLVAGLPPPRRLPEPA
jgi:tetraacyldisaccharide 4'-kinase